MTGKTYMVPKPMVIEKIYYPINEIEKIVDLIIKLNNQQNIESVVYNHLLDETISILNESLRGLSKPYLILDTNGKV